MALAGCLHGLKKTCVTEAVDLLVVLKSHVRPFLSLLRTQAPEPGQVVSGELILTAFKLRCQGAHPSSQLHVRVGLARSLSSCPLPFFPLEEC